MDHKTVGTNRKRWCSSCTLLYFGNTDECLRDKVAEFPISYKHWEISYSVDKRESCQNVTQKFTFKFLSHEFPREFFDANYNHKHIYARLACKFILYYVFFFSFLNQTYIFYGLFSSKFLELPSTLSLAIRTYFLSTKHDTTNFNSFPYLHQFALHQSFRQYTIFSWDNGNQLRLYQELMHRQCHMDMGHVQGCKWI